MGSLKTIGKLLPLLLSCAVNVGAAYHDNVADTFPVKENNRQWLVTRADKYGYVALEVTNYEMKISSLEARVDRLEKQIIINKIELRDEKIKRLDVEFEKLLDEVEGKSKIEWSCTAMSSVTYLDQECHAAWENYLKPEGYMSGNGWVEYAVGKWRPSCEDKTEQHCVRETGYGSDGKVYWRTPDTLKSQPPVIMNERTWRKGEGR